MDDYRRGMAIFTVVDSLLIFVCGMSDVLAGLIWLYYGAFAVGHGNGVWSGAGVIISVLFVFYFILQCYIFCAVVLFGQL